MRTALTETINHERSRPIKNEAKKIPPDQAFSKPKRQRNEEEKAAIAKRQRDEREYMAYVGSRKNRKAN